MASPGLSTVLEQRRAQLLAAWTQSVASNIASAPSSRAAMLDQMPAFVDEVIRALHPEAMPFPPRSENAEEHGAQRFGLGFDVGEVVREYGLLHDCILEVAANEGMEIGLRDQSVIAKWVNNGIAEAIAQYASYRDLESQRQASEHLGFIAHELRTPLGVAGMALRRLRQIQTDGAGTKEPSPGERWMQALDRNLRRATELIESTLNHAALKLGVDPKPVATDLAALLHELELDAESEAQAQAIEVVVSVEEALRVHVDPRLLRSAISNLLYNALKFSRPGATVTLAAKRSGERLTIDVSDGCGGLPPGKAEELFAPFVQKGDNRTGFGLGLAIARQAAEAHNGTLKVRDIPGSGCVFSLDLPIVLGPAP